MIETHTRILGIAPYDGMRTAMEQAAQAYPNVEMDIYTGDLEDGQAIVQQMPPNSYDCIISRGGTAALRRGAFGERNAPTSGWCIIAPLVN